MKSQRFYPRFFMFGLIGSATIFVPLLFVEDISYTKSFVIYGIVFSVINAILEALLWRGIMLSHLKSNLSTFSAVFITSIGFGLYEYWIRSFAHINRNSCNHEFAFFFWWTFLCICRFKDEKHIPSHSFSFYY